MKKLIFYLIIIPFYAKAQNSDCATSNIILNNFDPLKFDFVQGAGLLPNEANDASCFSGGGNQIESNSLWIKWTCQKAGTLTFVITPDNLQDDIDFVLYETKAINNCDGKKIIRCMAAGETLNGCALLGATGLKIGEVDISESSGCDGTKNNFLKPLDMEEGKTYALMINNFTSSKKGFSISFGGDGEIKSTSIAEIDNEENGFNVFPNPLNSNILNIRLKHSLSSNNTLVIQNLLGEIVFTKENIQVNESLILNDAITNGLYIISLQNNSKIVSSKFIISK